MNRNGSPQNLTAKCSLKKGDARTREIAMMGVQARKEKALKRKQFKETIDVVLRASMKKGATVSPEDVISIAEAKNKNVDAQTAIVIAMVQRATMGDVQSAIWLRDTVGEKPKDKVEVDQSLTIEEWAKNHKVKL